MHFVNSLSNYLSSKVENRLLGMNERNYSLGDTFKLALECELKAITSERRHMKHNAALTNQVKVIQPQALLQSKEISEVHMPTRIIKVRIMTQTSRQSEWKQHTQLLTTASSHNNHRQWLTNTKPLTTNQLPHMAPATTTHH